MIRFNATTFTLNCDLVFDSRCDLFKDGPEDVLATAAEGKKVANWNHSRRPCFKKQSPFSLSIYRFLDSSVSSLICPSFIVFFLFFFYISFKSTGKFHLLSNMISFSKLVVVKKVLIAIRS